MFYENGVSGQFATTHTMLELKRILVSAKKSNSPAEIDTISEQDEIADDVLVMHMDKVLFYIVAEPNASDLIIPKPGLVKLQ